jgi:glycosyltransferase involved in cell wall biosynthesis
MKPTCSIVIRAYNEEKHIGRLLTGIAEQSLKSIQTILVDSGSTDGTVQIAQEFPVEVVHIRPEEFSFGRSLNLGIERARADVVVMASAHVYPVYPDWLEKLIHPFESGQVALAYGKQRGVDVSHFSEQQLFRQWFPEQSQNRQAHPFCNNANAAIRRDLWETHPYDENIPALEDLAWAKWAHEQGLLISYVSEAEVIHIHQETWQGIRNRYRREGMAFKQIYPHEKFGRRDLLRLWLANTLQDFKAAAGQGLLAGQWWNIMRFRWMQFGGTYQGYRHSGPLTWQLKQTFYYPRPTEEGGSSRNRPVAPIQYSDLPGKNS